MYRIGIDLDGVLGNILNGVEVKAKELYNIDISQYPITNYMLETCTPLTSEQLQFMFDETDLFSTLDTIPYANSALSLLSKEGNELNIITYRNVKHTDVTGNWLKDNKLIYNELHLVDSRDKREIARKLNLDYFVEDRRETVLQLAEVCKECFLLDWSYNQEELPDNCHRINGWLEIFKWL